MEQIILNDSRMLHGAKRMGMAARNAELQGLGQGRMGLQMEGKYRS